VKNAFYRSNNDGDFFAMLSLPLNNNFIERGEAKPSSILELRERKERVIRYV
jgi:hypothetical protein